MAREVLQISALGKRYRLGMVGRGSLSQDLARLWRGAFKASSLQPSSANDFWALQHVSFSLHEGEVLGLIGKNGAGKSTLLKLLARITAPTEGRIKARGRIAGLLEVGTGMHPELSGRENVYLNGAILGLSREEVARRFDEIVDFSGCEVHIDTPVKRYSSGMKVRLGFAVAAFLEPDILAIDEVLAVGDAAFQQKAIARLQQVCADTGRSAIFVSHNMASVRNLCSRAICLEQGKVAYDGATEDAIAAYLGYGSAGIVQRRVWPAEQAPRTELAQVHYAGISCLGKDASAPLSIADTLNFELGLECFEEDCQLDCTLQVYSDSGVYLASSGSLYFEDAATKRKGKRITFQCTIPPNYFNQGVYRFNVLLVVGGRSSHLLLEDVLRVSFGPPSRNPELWMGTPRGHLLPGWKWTRSVQE